MILANPHFAKIQASYLFSTIAARVREFSAAHPDARLIRLGIGDVTRALPPACVEAMQKAVGEMGADATFRGYGPEFGYDFLRETIAKADFQSRGADIQADEIFVSDGAKCDTGNFQELFAAGGFTITSSILHVTVAGKGDAAAIRAAAEAAKAGCPVSKVLACEVGMELTIA